MDIHWDFCVRSDNHPVILDHDLVPIDAGSNPLKNWDLEEIVTFRHDFDVFSRHFCVLIENVDGISLTCWFHN